MSCTSVDIGQVETRSFKFKWVIKNFCTGCKKVGDKLVSPKILTSANGWRLWLYPKGDKDVNKDYFSIFLCYLNETQIQASAQFIILNNKNHVAEKRFAGNLTFNKQVPNWGFSRFIKRSLIVKNGATGIVINDTLTILCKITIGDKIKISSETNETQMKVPECALRLKEFDDYEKLLENEKFSDVILAVDGKKIHAHKSILANKSVVFAAMFDYRMKENNKKIVQIHDVTYAVLKELLRFIYAGKVNEIVKLAIDLLAAADKFGLEGLKIICEKSLCEKLSCNNALKYLKIAELHNAIELKIKTIKFIVSHAEDIVEQPQFKLLCELHSNVMREVFRALVNVNKEFIL